MKILDIEQLNEKLDIKPVTKERLDDMKNMFDSYVVRLSLWSKSFMCKFGNSDWVDLVETNQYVKCKRCNYPMTLDFIQAKKKCPKCGYKYEEINE